MRELCLQKEKGEVLRKYKPRTAEREKKQARKMTQIDSFCPTLDDRYTGAGVLGWRAAISEMSGRNAQVPMIELSSFCATLLISCTRLTYTKSWVG